MSPTCAPSPAMQLAAIGVGGHMSPAHTIFCARLTPTKWGGNATALSPVSSVNKQATHAETANAPREAPSQHHPSHLQNAPALPRRHQRPRKQHPKKHPLLMTRHHHRPPRTRAKVRQQQNHSSQPSAKPPPWTTSQSASNPQEPSSIGRGPRNEQCIKEAAPQV
jgi:hypothetical protein